MSIQKWMACVLAVCMLMSIFADFPSALTARAEEETAVWLVEEEIAPPAPQPAAAEVEMPVEAPMEKPIAVPEAAIPEESIVVPSEPAPEVPAEEEPSSPAPEESPAAGTKEPVETIEPSQGEEPSAEDESTQEEAPPVSEDASETESSDPVQEPAEDEEPMQEEEPAAAIPPAQEPEPELPDEDYGEGPVYVLENGIRHFGEPEELIPLDKPIYLYNYLLIEISGYSIERLQNVRFLLGGGFADDDVIYLSVRDPSGRVKDGVVFLWAGPEQPSLENNADRLGDVINATEDEYLEMEIMVRSENYASDAPCLPTFHLTAIPEPTEGMAFAVSVNDGVPQMLLESSLTPAQDGEYRFLLLAEDGTELARSNKYSVELIQPSDPEWEEDLLEESDLLPAIPSAPEIMEEAPEILMPEEEDEEVHLDFFPAENLPAEPQQEPVLEIITPAQDSADFEEILLDAAQTLITKEIALEEDAVLLYDGSETAEFTDDTLILQEDSLLFADAASAEEFSEASVVLEVEATGDVSFQLSGLPSDGQHVYTVQYNGGEPVTLLTSSYIAQQNGEYVFAIVDSEGTVMASSEVYTVTSVQDIPSLESCTLTVTAAADSVIGKWTNKAPAFTLAVDGLDALPDGCSYAVIAKGEAVSALSEASVIDLFKESSYSFTLEGAHQVQFALVDVVNDRLLAVSEQTFDIRLDTTAPVVIATALDGYAVRVVVGDQLSSAKAVYISTDGGTTWTKSSGLQDLGQGISSSDESILTDESIKAVEFVASRALVLPAGKSIKAVDEAGNETLYGKDITLFSLKAQQSQMSGMMSGFTSFGGFRGGGGTYRSVSHSKSDVEDITAYNAVRLIVDDGSMHTLRVGDEQLDLQLTRDDFLVSDQDNASASSFTASFAAWNGSSGVDTLILAASDPQSALETGLYTWSFSGAVYKKLAASGIDYLVLRIGDQATALSTAGFSAGIRYNMYRAEGLPSKDFRYEIRMGMPASSFEMDVTVSGETYRMSADPASEFYYYDVYNGSAGLFGVLAEG